MMGDVHISFQSTVISECITKTVHSNASKPYIIWSMLLYCFEDILFNLQPLKQYITDPESALFFFYINLVKCNQDKIVDQVDMANIKLVIQDKLGYRWCKQRKGEH